MVIGDSRKETIGFMLTELVCIKQWAHVHPEFYRRLWALCASHIVALSKPVSPSGHVPQAAEVFDAVSPAVVNVPRLAGVMQNDHL